MMMSNRLGFAQKYINLCTLVISDWNKNWPPFYVFKSCVSLSNAFQTHLLCKPYIDVLSISLPHKTQDCHGAKRRVMHTSRLFFIWNTGNVPSIRSKILSKLLKKNCSKLYNTYIVYTYSFTCFHIRWQVVYSLSITLKFANFIGYEEVCIHESVNNFNSVSWSWRWNLNESGMEKYLYAHRV